MQDDDEREVEARYGILVAEMIERALFAAQQLCDQIESGDAQAIETARDVKGRIGTILQTWDRWSGNTPKTMI